MTVQHIIETFVTNHLGLYQKMTSCEHGYLGKNPNPFHLEGSIWTHTMMVLNEAKDLSDVQKIAALCHDIGKPFVFEDNNEKQRRYFTNHEAVSTFYAKDVVESFDLNYEEKNRVLAIVSQHGSLYNYFEDGRIPEKNYNKVAAKFKSVLDFHDTIQFYECDHNGRFNTGETRNNKQLYEDFSNISNIISSREPNTTIYDASITILVGPPRVGKSTWVSKNVTDEVVISRDRYVEEIGVGNTYSECWNSLTPEDQNKIDSLLQKDFSTAIKNKKSVVVDMTNMSKKARRKWISGAKNHKKIARVFVESPSCLLSRNTPEKHIPVEVIERMMKNFVMPQYDEFDEIEIHGIQ